jgi:hypothetical protein
MKNASKAGKAPAAKSKKPAAAPGRTHKMEPLKAKENKNQRFDMEDEDLDPEVFEEDFGGFEESFVDDDEDDD